MSRFSAVLAAALFLSGIAFPADNDTVDYGRDVRPILSENCFHCHGQDSSKRMAGLRLDNFESAAAPRGKRTALVPRHPEQSAIIDRITAQQASRRMPPVSSNRTLTSEQIRILRRWIEQGGAYTKHWAFIPAKRPPLPTISDARWIKQPLDAFIHERLESDGLRPSAPAAPAAWLRRVSLDLTGLPPNPADVDLFIKDVRSRGEAAYGAAVDRLIGSPQYGERMASDWLDVARYADTHGFNNDSTRSMWRWRDWVIDSFNANMPYDRFVTEQLAGDLLPNPTLDQRIATGLGRNHVINSEGGIIEEEYRVEYVADRVRTLGMSWLGLTIECARCHDHKFDPISQRDYYRFYSFFNNIPERGEDGRVTNAIPLMPAPTREQQRRMQELEAAIAKLTSTVERRERSWTWRPPNAEQVLRLADRTNIPSGAVLQVQCESVAEFDMAQSSALVLVDGSPDGRACQPGGARIQTSGVPVSKRDPLTFSFWLRPEITDIDVALLSAADYSASTASVTYGKGIELRLVRGELEFRFGDRFPAYSIRVRSEGAAIKSDQWRHLTVLYEGAAGRETGRADASWVRIFADGRELPTTILNEGVSLPEASSGGKPAQTRFRLGWDNGASSRPLAGRLDEISIWPQALTDDEISNVFEHRALPWAVARQRSASASSSELEWLRRAVLRSSHAGYARDARQLSVTRAQLFSLRRTAPTVMVMEELADKRETHILFRGVYNAPGELVDSGVPEQLLGPWPTNAPRNRLGLARWLTNPDHPLTARVVVNRFWQQLFGNGLVKTSDNFGLQGESPSHPELLDWLAREFVESGWNVKALMKQLVLSATYRQDSAASPEMYARDPENRLLARGPRFRLPAEAIRDQALFVSGLLKNHVGGPSVYPYQPRDLYKGIVVAANYPGTKYIESTGDDLYRRSLYTFWKRTVPHPTMTVFDAPDREFCIVKRSTTNTPLQALTLLNDPIYVEAAKKLADRSFQEGRSTADERVRFMFRVATGRLPTAAEMAILRKTYDQMLSEYQSHPEAATSFLAIGASAVNRAIPVEEMAATAAVANMILNMDEVITRG
jgi:hypothetical protein